MNINLGESEQVETKAVVLSHGRERERHWHHRRRGVHLNEYANRYFVRGYRKCAWWLQYPCHFSSIGNRNCYCCLDKDSIIISWSSSSVHWRTIMSRVLAFADLIWGFKKVPGNGRLLKIRILRPFWSLGI